MLQVLLYCWTEVVLCETLELLDRFAVCGGVSVTLCPSCMKLCRISPTESHLHSPLLFHLFSLSLCLVLSNLFSCSFFSALSHLLSSFFVSFLLLFVSFVLSRLLCFFTPSLFFLSLSHLNSLSHLFLVSLHLLSSFCRCVLSHLMLSPVLSSPLCHVSSLPYVVLPPLSSRLHFSSHHLSCFVPSSVFPSLSCLCCSSHFVSSHHLFCLTSCLHLFSPS